MNSWDTTFMEVAELFAKHSTCVKRKVGAVLVKDRRIISCGYNGTPSGMYNCNEKFTSELEIHTHVDEKGFNHHLFSAKYEIHAEQNCFAFCCKHGIPIDEGCVLYVTTAPCCYCAKTILAHGIKKVVYRDEYKTMEGVEFLIESGVEVVHYEEEQK